MAALDTLDRLEGMEGLDDAQVEAAEKAETVGRFVADFRERSRELIEEGTVTKAEVDERERVVRAAAEGNEHLKLADLEANVLGQAMVGGGDGGVQLSRDVFAEAADASAVQRAQHVAAHELAHAEQAQLHGTLTVDGEEVDHVLLLEGDAELAGNEAVGKGMDSHREGQPEAVYAEGQDVVIDIVRKVGKAKFRQVLRGSGDVTELQGALAA